MSSFSKNDTASVARFSFWDLSKRFTQELSGDTDVVVVVMDAGNEIDDEIAAHLLMEHFKRGYLVFFAQVPGASIVQRSKVMQGRVERMREVFPDQFGKQDIWSPSLPEGFDGAYFLPPSTFVLCVLSDLLWMVNHNEWELQRRGVDQKFQVKWWLQIAPLLGFASIEFVNFEIESRIVMGDLENPEKSINCTKAIPKDESGDELRAGYYSQEETFKKNSTHTKFIPTSIARQVATPMCFIEQLPWGMKVRLLTTAFNQFVGRPDPKLPWAEDISIANHATIMKMLSKDKMYEVLSQPTEQRLVDIVIAFLKPEIDRREAVGEKPFGEFYPLRLGQIATAVEHITGVKYKHMTIGCTSVTQFQCNDQVDSLEDSVLARENWMTYISKNNCDLTPCYDGMAVLYMMYSVKRSGLVPWAEGLPSIEWCKQMLSRC